MSTSVPHEQARCLGRLLGVRWFRYADADALAQDAARCRGYHCMLIDTPPLVGATPRSTRRRAAAIGHALPGLATMLVLPASAQAGVIEDAVQPRPSPSSPPAAR